MVAALLGPPTRPHVPNEPETSLHPSLLAPPAELVTRASNRTQVLTVTRQPLLLAGLETAPGGQRVGPVEAHGETRVGGPGPLDGPPWHWPSR